MSSCTFPTRGGLRKEVVELNGSVMVKVEGEGEEVEPPPIVAAHCRHHPLRLLPLVPVPSRRQR